MIVMFMLSRGRIKVNFRGDDDGDKVGNDADGNGEILKDRPGESLEDHQRLEGRAPWC